MGNESLDREIDEDDLFTDIGSFSLETLVGDLNIGDLGTVRVPESVQYGDRTEFLKDYNLQRPITIHLQQAKDSGDYFFEWRPEEDLKIPASMVYGNGKTLQSAFNELIPDIIIMYRGYAFPAPDEQLSQGAKELGRSLKELIHYTGNLK